MKQMRKESVLGCTTAALAVFLAAGVILFIASPSAYAGDHLASSPPGCVDCHGTNIRQVHDYEYTVPADCDICHSGGGRTWYLNEACADYLNDGGISVIDGQLDLPAGLEFNFDCKACHVAENPGHQN